MDYTNIIELFTSTSVTEVNEFLKLGWILLGVPNEENYGYILGWNKQNGDTSIYPPEHLLYSAEIKKILEESKKIFE